MLRLQAAGLVTSFLMVTWTYALLSLRLYRPLLIANAAAAVVAIVATLELAPPLGAEGAALATVLAEATLAGVSLWGLRAEPPRPAPALRVVAEGRARADRRRSGVALLVPASPLVLSIVAGAVYAAVAFATRAVPPEPLTALRGRA